MEQLVHSVWNGYDRIDFTLNGKDGLLIRPKQAQRSMPWVWRAEFFDAFPNVDNALLAQGWHIAYYHLSDQYGCPSAVQQMKLFHDQLTAEFGLAQKCDLFGFSRGGLYATNYTAAFPQDVSVLYLDAPVMRIQSWPGGMGSGAGSPTEWQDCMKLYGLTEQTAKDFHGNPLDHAPTLAEHHIPVMLVAGGKDATVPFVENGAIFESQYRALGGEIQTIVKPDCGHHPHSLEDPSPVVDFIKSHLNEKTD